MWRRMHPWRATGMGGACVAGVPQVTRVAGIPRGTRVARVSRRMSVAGIPGGTRVTGIPRCAGIAVPPCVAGVAGIPRWARSVGMPPGLGVARLVRTARVVGASRRARGLVVPRGLRAARIPRTAGVGRLPALTRPGGGGSRRPFRGGGRGLGRAAGAAWVTGWAAVRRWRRFRCAAFLGGARSAAQRARGTAAHRGAARVAGGGAGLQAKFATIVHRRDWTTQRTEPDRMWRRSWPCRPPA